MPAILIKNLPPEVHKELKEQARLNRRSMAQQALALLEQGLLINRERTLPPIYQGKFLLTNEWINRAKREG